jgi:hypothetical protein
MKVLDLFSGLGGFSEAFLRSGDEVVRVENNPLLSEVPNTSIEDVRAMRDRLLEFKQSGQPIRSIDLVVASPPCLEFSMAYSSPRSVANRNGEEWNPSMELVEITLEIIQLLSPRWWVIENVIGSISYFEKIGLVPHQIHGACVFYGNFPKFSTPSMKTKAEKDSWHGDPLRMNKRALIPLELSMALRKAIISQKTLFDDYNIA